MSVGQGRTRSTPGGRKKRRKDGEAEVGERRGGGRGGDKRGGAEGESTGETISVQLFCRVGLALQHTQRYVFHRMSYRVQSWVGAAE